MTDTTLPIDDARHNGPGRRTRTRPLALSFRDALVSSFDPEVRLARRQIRTGVGQLPDTWSRVVAWMQPIQDKDLGRGWRCTLHAFGPGGRFERVQAASFEPAQAARFAVASLRERAL